METELSCLLDWFECIVFSRIVFLGDWLPLNREWRFESNFSTIESLTNSVFTFLALKFSLARTPDLLETINYLFPELFYSLDGSMSVILF